MEQDERRFEKGFFTRIRFAIATKYPALASRNGLFKLGAIAGGVIVLLLVADAFVGRSSIIAGPLSESHALFARDCSSCHVAIHGAENANCESCHQRSAGKGRAYTLGRHYQYKSDDVDRSAPKHLELSCAQCHREHQGRNVSLRAVSDNFCTRCHTTGSFGRGHPEFEFITKNIPDPSNLKFTHVRHVREVMEADSLTDAGRSCAHCHQAEEGGRFFKPVTFAKGCDGCHLTDGEKTPYIPQRSGGRPGVVSLAEARSSGEQWARYWNSSDFTEGGGTIRKSPVFHADPWVLYNLGRLRREMYPTAELADLLRTSSELPPGQTKQLYEEALRTLEARITPLRASESADVQNEVKGLDAMLKLVRARVEDPYATLDETQFAVTDASLAAGIDEAAYTAVVDSLTSKCQECHVVQRATIRRPQADQRALVRAEFDHRKHVLHANCLDCHKVIPVAEAIASGEKVPAERDRAEIQNLPAIAQCRECHTRNSAPVRCTSCHLFHPDKSHWSNLSR
jgi:predicted CXXCH cytochrome family protein